MNQFDKIASRYTTRATEIQRAKLILRPLSELQATCDGLNWPIQVDDGLENPLPTFRVQIAGRPALMSELKNNESVVLAFLLEGSSVRVYQKFLDGTEVRSEHKVDTVTVETFSLLLQEAFEDAVSQGADRARLARSAPSI